MKKIFTSLLCAMALLLNVMQPVGAMSYEDSYKKVQDYFKTIQEFSYADELIAYEALGLESDELKFNEEMLLTEKASDVAKSIIVLALHGEDPSNYNGVNYVELLESGVHDDGSVYFENEVNSFGSNNQIYNVYALYIVNSSKLELAVDYLNGMICESGAFSYAGGYESSDVTGWAIEALSLVNKTKYQSTIEKAIAYVTSKLDAEAAFNDGWGGNASTQGCVLMGLLTYDSEAVKNGTYNVNDINPMTYLLKFLNEDGSLWSPYTGEGLYDLYSTNQGGQAVGYYFNGSVYEDAKAEYAVTISSQKDNSTNKPENNNQTNVKEEIKEQTKVVQTDDTNSIYGLSIMLLVSVVIYLKGRKVVE